MIGKILGSRYKIIDRIGDGGMAIVYKTHCQLLDRYVAVKILKDEFVDDEEFIKKFKRESQAAASLSNPNIVNVFDVGVEEIDDKKIHYIVMEYVDGRTLKEVIKQEGPLPTNKVIDYSIQIATALQVAHKNHIVHRDIKPHNILITKDGVVKVTDFGIARAVTSSTITTTSNVLGSVHYFSPEQARGGYTDEKSDIYSLGVVMYEMATGKLPYEGDSPITVALKHVQDEVRSPREINTDIPKALEDIILKCLQKRQSDRYANIMELKKDLNKLQLDDNVGKVDETETEVEDEQDRENFLDEWPETDKTKLMPAVKVEDQVSGRRKRKRKNSLNGILQIIMGIILAFAIVVTVFVAKKKIESFTSNDDEVDVPKLVGLEIKEATDIMNKKGLKLVVKLEPNKEVAKDLVVKQSEIEGKKIKKNYPVEVIVSSGANLVRVPNVVNRNFNDASEELKAQKFLPKFKYEASDDIPKDAVISQEPSGGSEADHGAVVSVLVSLGSSGKKIKMPNLVDKNEVVAKNELIALGVNNIVITKQANNNFDAGKVSWQSVESGEQISADQTIDLYISLGAQEKPKEEEPVKTEDTPIEVPEIEEPSEPGIKSASVNLDFTDKTEDDTIMLKIVRTYDGMSETIRESQVDVSSKVLNILLEGQVGTKFDIFYNGLHFKTVTIE